MLVMRLVICGTLEMFWVFLKISVGSRSILFVTVPVKSIVCAGGAVCLFNLMHSRKMLSLFRKATDQVHPVSKVWECDSSKPKLLS